MATKGRKLMVDMKMNYHKAEIAGKNKPQIGNPGCMASFASMEPDHMS